MKIILLLLVVLAFTFWTAIIDAEHYVNKQFVKDHNSRWMQRVSFIFAIAVFDLVGGIAAGLIFTVLFDQVLNWKRGLPTFYFGTEAKWDKFWANNLTFYIAMKITALAIVVLLVVYAKSNLW